MPSTYVVRKKPNTKLFSPVRLIGKESCAIFRLQHKKGVFARYREERLKYSVSLYRIKMSLAAELTVQIESPTVVIAIAWRLRVVNNYLFGTQRIENLLFFRREL